MNRLPINGVPVEYLEDGSVNIHHAELPSFFHWADPFYYEAESVTEFPDLDAARKWTREGINKVAGSHYTGVTTGMYATLGGWIGVLDKYDHPIVEHEYVDYLGDIFRVDYDLGAASFFLVRMHKIDNPAAVIPRDRVYLGKVDRSCLRTMTSFPVSQQVYGKNSSLFMAYARADELEQRNRLTNGMDKDKWLEVVSLIDKLHDRDYGVTKEELTQYKLEKYA